MFRHEAVEPLDIRYRGFAKIKNVPKRICTSRAEWRLQTGKPAEALSANYRLECDYGTSVILCWEKGGSEPIYVCESHAKELGPSREHGQEARIISAESGQKDNPIRAKVRNGTDEVAVTKANGSALPEARALKVEPEENDSPIQSKVPSQTLEVAVTKSDSSALPEASRKLEEPKAERKVAEASTKTRVRDLTFEIQRRPWWTKLSGIWRPEITRSIELCCNKGRPPAKQRRLPADSWP